MTNDDGRKPEGAPERFPKAGGGAPSGVDGNGPKRFSVPRKMAVVARLLRGEPLELVARETNVSIARLTEWRERALAGAATALKERDDRNDEIADAVAPVLEDPLSPCSFRIFRARATSELGLVPVNGLRRECYAWKNNPVATYALG